MKDPGLYAIVDLDALSARNVPLLPFARAVLEARPARQQLRAKSASANETLALLRALRQPCTAAGAQLFANDRPDLALLAGCDGVHVGQEDLEVQDVRRFAPALRIGVSTHDLGQLDRALAARPDYVAFGPVFPTRSKARPDPVVGLEGLGQAAARAGAARIPLVAIGGIGLEDCARVAELGASAAIIGALVEPAPDLEAVSARAKALVRALSG